MNEHQRPFIWFPNQLPYLVKADRVQDIVHHVPESAKIYADRVQENVPTISQSATIAMSASTGGSSSSRALPVDALAPLPGPPRRESLEDEPIRRLDDLPRSEEPLVLRAKMTARYHRKRGFEVDPEEAPPFHYCHQLRSDDIILGEDLTKGSEGERACLV